MIFERFHHSSNIEILNLHENLNVVWLELELNYRVDWIVNSSSSSSTVCVIMEFDRKYKV